MEYVSTRGGIEPQSFSTILLEGLAPDGGLTVPAVYPHLEAPELAALRPLDYRSLACALLAHYIDDIPEKELRSLVDRTYTAGIFGSEDITPLTTLEPGVLLLRASNGPTLAFKDVAMQLLGNLFEHALAREERDLNILGATSGDTGSSAEYAMRGKLGIRVFMLSPRDRMSPFQTAQMYSLDDPNIFNIAIDG
ncbi:MAG: threonine synthase, partial [Casimicrobiaceae bacterium]